MPADPTPPAPAPLTAEEEAPLRSVVRPGAVIPCDVQSVGALIHVIRRLLATLDATRAELTSEKEVTAVLYEQRDDAFRTVIHRERERDAARAALARVERELAAYQHAVTPIHFSKTPSPGEVKARTEMAIADATDLRDADQAGRALVAALRSARLTLSVRGLLAYYEELDKETADAITRSPSRWRTGEETE